MRTSSILITAFFFTTLTMPNPLVATNAVLDTSGLEVLAGTEYYILPVYHGKGGGLTAQSRNATCPFTLNVAQEFLDTSNGLPLIFLPINTSSSSSKVVELSVDINIVFSSSPMSTCQESTVWRLRDADDAGQRFVTTGGVTGNPSISTLSNWFKIKASGDGYKLVFCPGFCQTCKIACGDVGVIYEDGKRWLGVSNVDPLLVMFIKV